MKKYYIAGIVPEKDGGFSVYFPDLPTIAAGGDSIEEAIGNASEGLVVALRGIAEQKGKAPAVSSLDAVKKQVKAERKTDGLPYPDATVYQYFAAPSIETVPVRVNVTIPKAALDEIDAKAKQYGYTRSGFLAHAAAQYHE